MGEYIKREAVIDLITRRYENPEICTQEINSIPAADVAPVVHGRWVTHYRSGTTVAEGYVSTCCDMWNNRKNNYCPACGAKMDGGDSNALNRR
jgi:hypothetical protein